MKKRFLMLLIIAALAFSVAACGGSSDTEETEDTAAVEETEAVAQEDTEAAAETTDDAYSTLAYAYAGVSDNGDYYYVASDENVEYMVWAYVDAEQTGYMRYMGDVTTDDSAGTMTITDSETGETVSFGFESMDGGGTMTLEDGTKVTLGAVTVDEFKNVMANLG